MAHRATVRVLWLFLVYLALTQCACAQLKPGVVVEEVARNSGGDKAGLKQGDLLLTWSRGDSKGNIESPFDLHEIEIEQQPRGNVMLEGLRGTEHRAWAMVPEDWHVSTRPDLPENLLSIYQQGYELAKAGKLKDAAERWRAASVEAQSIHSSWLPGWFLFRAATMLADGRQLKDAADAYQDALQQTSQTNPKIAIELLENLVSAYVELGDRDKAEAYAQQALSKSLESGESLSTVEALRYLYKVAWERGDLDKEDAYARRGLTIVQKLAPASFPAARMLLNIGVVAHLRGDLATAEDYERRGFEVEEKIVPNSFELARSLYNLGAIAFARGDLGRAQDYFQRGLAIGQKFPTTVNGTGINPIYGTGINANGLGDVFLMRGDLEKAEKYYRLGLDVREAAAPDSVSVARSLSTLAEVARTQGDLARAEKYGLRALAIIEKLGPETPFAAEILNNMGRLADDQGNLLKAEEYLQGALAIHEKTAADEISLVGVLNELGRVAWEGKDYSKAEQYLRRGLSLGEKAVPDGPAMAETLHEEGNVARDRGDKTAAKEYYSRALAIREKLAPGGLGDVESLMALASLLRDQQPDLAAQLFEKAVNAVENQAAHLGGTEESQSNFRAQRADYYEEYVDLLVQQKQSERAFDIVERSRARTLLEILVQAHINIRSGVDAKLLEKESSLQADLRAKSERRIELQSDKQKQQYEAAVDQEIKKLLEDYQEVERQIRLNSPGYAALTQPQPLSAKEIQQQLLDSDTVLLEYSLGEQRSYIFALTSSGLHLYELPKRATIEQPARELYQLLRTRNNPVVEAGNALAKPAAIKPSISRERHLKQLTATLSQMVLGPAASEIHARRLLIVSDGALEYIPFSVLPVPEASGGTTAARAGEQRPLMIDHELVNLPSASVLALLRQQAASRAAPEKMIAILADPVFDKEDDRVAKVPSGRPVEAVGPGAEGLNSDPGSPTLEKGNLLERLTRSWTNPDRSPTRGFFLTRLPYTRREAQDILAVIPPGTGLQALDFDASRSTALDPKLAQYRIVHFATHSFLDSEHPELSALAFSMVDQRGNRQDGLVGLQDIYNLNLPADLVVLSACETALGKEIKGEGLMGLTRGFMYAGATRVVASLWKVDDVATAELMQRFYMAMEQEKMRPAAALQKAQVEMWRQQRWRNPYYWAAFELQGEWK
jgi:CHAT domain-containing protein/Tfp pilus assembly protein PilF